MSDCGHECYRVGGPWIAEDPDCPVHGTEAQALQRAQEQLLETGLELSSYHGPLSPGGVVYDDPLVVRGETSEHDSSRVGLTLTQGGKEVYREDLVKLGRFLLFLGENA